MPKVLILFYSRTGRTAQLAEAIAEGARGVRFTEADLRRVDELAPAATIEANADWAASRDALAARYRTLDSYEALADYDGLILGAPTRYGVMAAELKYVLDQTGPLWRRGALVDKVGAAFTTVSTPHGGHETTLWSIMTPMANLGMILVPPGYTDPATFKGGSPYGATATTGSAAGGGPTPDDLAVARQLGRRVATVSEWVRHAKGHEAAAEGAGHSHGHHHHH